MTELSTDFSSFEADAFLTRAAARLRLPTGRGPGGDHVLNPGMNRTVANLGGYRDAAVLIPVIAARPASVLFTVRTPRLSAHAGQVSFPGGKIDPADPGATAAALREAEEEIGLDPARVEIIGELDPYLTGTGFRIVPVLARVAPSPELRINHEEVAEIFEVPLAFLMTPGNIAQKSRVLGGHERHFYEMEFGGHIIWGATAGIIVALQQRVFG